MGYPANVPTRISLWYVKGMGIGSAQLSPEGFVISVTRCLCDSQRHKRPPGARQRVASGTNRSSRPTAREVTVSKHDPGIASRYSSRRSQRTSTGSILHTRATSFRNARFLETGSSRVTRKAGKAIFSASPGKPAPLPTSSRRPLRSSHREMNRLSPKCRVMHSSSLQIAVRLILRFQCRSKLRYATNWPVCAAESSSPKDSSNWVIRASLSMVPEL